MKIRPNSLSFYGKRGFEKDAAAKNPSSALPFLPPLSGDAALTKFRQCVSTQGAALAILHSFS